MDSLSSINFFPPLLLLFFFLLAAIMRGSFIIDAMFNVPLVAVFMLQSHRHFYANNTHSTAKNSGLQIKTIGVGFQLPFRKPRSVVCIVAVFRKGMILPRKVLKTGMKCVPVCLCLSLSILKQIAVSYLFGIFTNPPTLTPITQRAPVASFQP